MKSFATRIAVASTLALSLLASSLGPVHAQAFTSYDSGVQVQNLENKPGSVTLKSYKEDGTETTVVPSDPIGANGSNNYYGPTLPLGEGFKGSMVVSADVQVAAIANINTPGFAAAASYLAASEGSTTVQLPLLMKNNAGYNTWFAVQNTAGVEATINIAYSSGLNINGQKIPPGAAKTFYQKDENHSKPVFSAIITSDQPIVAAVIEENDKQMLAYTGFTGGSTAPVFPLVNTNNIGLQTGIQILNFGGVPTDVTVTYTPAPGANNGQQCTETQTIPSQDSRTFALHVFALGESNAWDQASNCVDGARFVGSAKVTTNSANTELTAIVNQSSKSDSTTVMAGAYGAFDPAAATGKVVLPLVLKNRGAAYKFWTGFNIQNLSGTASTLQCTYTKFGSMSADLVRTYDLPANGAANVLQNADPDLPEDYYGSATCTTNPNVPVVGVVNELSQTDPISERLLVYEGANID